VFGDNRETQSAADTVPRSGASRKTFKDAHTLADTNPGSIVIDDEQEISCFIATEENLRCSTGVVSRVIEQVEQDALDATSVEIHHVIVAKVGHYED
jgi:hypothetical protein